MRAPTAIEKIVHQQDCVAAEKDQRNKASVKC